MKRKDYEAIKTFLEREIEGDITNRGCGDAMRTELEMLEAYKNCKWYTPEDIIRNADRTIKRKMIETETAIYKWEEKYYNGYIQGLETIQREVIKWQKGKE